MVYRLEYSVRIEASPQEVWATMQDFTKRTLWDMRVVEASLLSMHTQGKGSRFKITYRVFGVKFWVENEYIVWKPCERSAIRAVGFSRPSMFKSAAGSWHFADNGDGSMTWTTIVSLSMVGGPLAPLLEKVGIGWYFRRLTERSGQNLKRLAESRREPRVGITDYDAVEHD